MIQRNRTTTIFLLVTLFLTFTAIRSDARRGCCSHHGGVCGCQCCDGTDLSAKCKPYYPNCEDTLQQQSNDEPSYKPPSSTEKIINEHLPYGYPSKKNILYRTGYVLSFDTDRHVADWVCYHMTVEYLNGTVERTDNFRPDPDMLGKGSELVDYKGSGFDRGHLCPAGDMKRSRTTMSESFLLTNIAPQRPEFNRGVWKLLEDKVRDWIRIRGNVNICTGSIYLDDDNDGKVDFDEIGVNKIAVPDAFYKIVVSKKENNLDVIAFILSNKEYPRGTTLADSIYSIDDVEAFTGLDFLNLLPDALEEQIEASRAKSLWN